MSDYAGFGHYLKTHRCSRGLTLHDVSRSTRLPQTVLGALEEGRSEQLPERVFLVAHIRSYASAVGLEPGECLSRFQALPGAPRREVFDPCALEAGRRERATLTLWGAAALGSVLVGAGTYLALADWMLKFAQR